MKTLNFKFVLVALFMMGAVIAFAQQPDLQYYRTGDSDGLNVFETPKTNDVLFEGLRVRVGGDFALQFQSINQSNFNKDFIKLGSDFNLPNANLNMDAQLADGMRVHLRTYLSARHHNEAWVKGGHLQIDKLDFIKPGFASGIMDKTTIRIGLDEINYGDAHFRRTDNARAYYNPFVGNYIMDAFTTEAFGEVNFQTNGFLAVVGLSNGKLNQSVVLTPTSDNKVSIYGKLGYDNQISEDLRVRLTGSFYMNKGTTSGTSLYGGDRAGDRYYNTFITNSEKAGKSVILADTAGNNPFKYVTQAGATATSSFMNARVNPGFKQITSVQVNPFIKFKGLELFGIYEVAMNSKDEGQGKYTQIAAEMIYRFGADEKFFAGGRYNQVSGKAKKADATGITVNRINVGGGWFLTKNTVAKIEYVNQQYTKGAGKWQDAQFKGLMLEASIGF
jgi:hypothetical protein